MVYVQAPLRLPSWPFRPVARAVAASHRP